MTLPHVRSIYEFIIDGKRLGRNINHDPRSLAYAVKPRASLAVSVLWNRRVDVFDQGALGSCTGNAACGVLGSDPYWGTLSSALSSGLTLNEGEAVVLYGAATKLDSYIGSYPPEDTGSDGLSVAKAAKNAGLISGYTHCLSIDAVVTALQAGPVITGVNWYDSFDSPDTSGDVVISKDATVRGGHEFELIGVDVNDRTFRAVNSWGDCWGDHGYFTIDYADYDRLLHEDGDATQFTPITSSPPQPTPTPTPADAFPWDKVNPWLNAPHWWRRATVAANAIKAWRG